MWVWWQLSIVNVNLMSPEHCEYEFYETWALQRRILLELSTVNVNLIQAEHYQCDFFESWALQMRILFELSWTKWIRILWDLSIVNKNLWELSFEFNAEYYKSWAMWIWILQMLSFVNCISELRFANVNYMTAEHCKYESMRAEHCKYEFYESWALKMWILWELSFVNVNFIRAELCK